MLRVPLKASFGLRCTVLGLATIFTALAVSTAPADARRARKGKATHHRAKVVKYAPPYAAIVVDANSGKVLHASNADSQRHPASLTKIMTLYLLFEQLETSKLKLGSELEVSPHASAQAPSKLGLSAGENIAVETAIRALVTKSANDVAVVVAEALAGSEAQFARQMTQKAHALGMSRTIYRNASGLPNPDQFTTARDQALLGRAIQERFPKYYRYFATPTFTYRGHAMRNHNKLLGRVAGVDGIKTGYVEASGFNLVTSVRRGNRHLVAVVLGGRSGSARDARMRDLIAQHIGNASPQRTAPTVAEIARAEVARAETPVGGLEPQSGSPPAPILPASAAAPIAATTAVQTPASEAAMSRVDPVATAAISAPTAAGDEMRPIPVKTVKVRASTLPTAAIGAVVASTAPPVAGVTPVASITPEMPVNPPAPPSPITEIAAAAPADAAAPPAPTSRAPLADAARAAPLPAVAAESPPQPPGPLSFAAIDRHESLPNHSGWMIQVGALETLEAAHQRIAIVRAKAANLLNHSSAFTEPVAKGDRTLYRARFAGLEKASAEAACKALKRADIVCMPIRN